MSGYSGFCGLSGYSGFCGLSGYSGFSGVIGGVYAGASPPTTDVGVFTIVKTGIDFKAAATTDIFTVPAGRTFVMHYSQVILTVVSGGLAAAMQYSIIESGASALMGTNAAIASAAPLTTKNYHQANVVAATISFNCAAAAKVQCRVDVGWASSTTVTGSVFVTGYYVT